MNKCTLWIINDGCHVVQLCLNNRFSKKVVLHAFTLPNEKLISKNLAFCALSRNKRLDLSTSAQIGEKI